MIKKGDPVTVVWTLRRTCAAQLYRGTVWKADAEGIYVKLSGLGTYIGQNFPATREGITWIRGNHNQGSDEGRALLVAYALVNR